MPECAGAPGRLAMSAANPAPVAFEVVAIATSAGGLRALSAVLAALPAAFPPIVVVQHLDPHHQSLMANILDRRTPLHVEEAASGVRLRSGAVFIAPPDRHLLIEPDRTIALTRTELVHFVRPSADLLFESVAATFRTRAIAVVLTGTGSDGAMGIQTIKKLGGTTIAEDPATAEFTGMPLAAIATGDVDQVLPLTEIAPALRRLVGQGDA